MIKYNINVVPEPVYHQQQSTSWYHNMAPHPEINSQADLDKWCNETAFKVGKYITFGPAVTIHNARSIYQIVSHVTDYSQLQRQSYAPYNPKVIWKQSIYRDSDGKADPAILDDLRGLRLLSQEEIDTVVKVYLDSVRNHSSTSA